MSEMTETNTEREGKSDSDSASEGRETQLVGINNITHSLNEREKRTNAMRNIRNMRNVIIQIEMGNRGAFVGTESVLARLFLVAT